MIDAIITLIELTLGIGALCILLFLIAALIEARFIPPKEPIHLGGGFYTSGNGRGLFDGMYVWRDGDAKEGLPNAYNRIDEYRAWLIGQSTAGAIEGKPHTTPNHRASDRGQREIPSDLVCDCHMPINQNHTHCQNCGSEYIKDN